MNLKSLGNYFPPQDIEWRIGRSGPKNDGSVWAVAMAYVTNRAIMERLDDICGPENWKNEFRAGPAGGVLCGISIKLSGEWVTKWDGADNTRMEATKGGLSGAMKRAAVQWGIGRYLYKLPECFVETGGYGKFPNRGSFKNKTTNEFTNFTWKTPPVPEEFIPEGCDPEASPAPNEFVDEETPVVLITEEQRINLSEICESKNWNVMEALARLAAKYGVKKIDHLPRDQFDSAKEFLNGFSAMAPKGEK